MKSKIAIGSALLGMNYGIAQLKQKVSLEEVRRILDLASHSGVEILDTAPSYGASEAVLGITGAAGFQVVTKTANFDPAGSKRQILASIRGGLEDSAEKLGCRRVYGLLLHNPTGLLGYNGVKVFECLEACREAGLVEKIGISIYHAEQYLEIDSSLKLDLIQVPLSILDQRMSKSSTLLRMKRDGLEVHARSIFLQGLLLTRKEDVHEYFLTGKHGYYLRSYYDALEKWQLTPAQACLYYALSIDSVDKIVLGVGSASELQELLEIERNMTTLDYDFDKLSCELDSILNPMRWQI